MICRKKQTKTGIAKQIQQEPPYLADIFQGKAISVYVKTIIFYIFVFFLTEINADEIDEIAFKNYHRYLLYLAAFTFLTLELNPAFSCTFMK